MKSGNKNGTKKKEQRKPLKGEKSSAKTVKELRKSKKIDTDFHHMHPFKEQ